MRRTHILLASVVAALVAVPVTAPAQERSIAGQLFRTVTTPFRVLGGAVAPRRTAYVTAPLQLQAPAQATAKKRRSVAARSNPRPRVRAAAIAPSTDPPRSPSDFATEARAMPPAAAPERRPEARSADLPPQAVGTSGWHGPLYWPSASDDLFDYAFQPSNAVDWFWARGSGDLFDAIFMRAGDTKSGWAEMCGSRRGGSHSWIEPMRQAINPTPAQVQLINDLRDSMVKAANEVRSACPAPDTLANPSQRLEAMTDRLWALRQAVIIVRPPLESLASSLNLAQQARLNTIDAEAVAQPSRSTNSRAQASRPAPMCGPPLSPFAEWPTREIEQRVRPADEQRQALEMLRMTTLGMVQLLMASCPTDVPHTPLMRLDVAEKRLDALLYSARVVAPAVNGFYLALADEQKAAFNALGRLAGNARPPSEARGERSQ